MNSARTGQAARAVSKPVVRGSPIRLAPIMLDHSVANISHELRIPISDSVGWLELISGRALDSNHADVINVLGATA